MYIVKYSEQVHMARMHELASIIHSITFLAHLSQRLIGELIGYSWSGVRPSSVVRRPSSVRRKQFQTSSSPKPLGRSKPNFMWSLLG